MLREWAGLVRRIVVGVDGAILCVSLVAACVARAASNPLGGTTLLQQHVWLLWVIVPTWLTMLRWVGLYESARYRSYTTIIRGVIIAHVMASLTLLSVLYLSRAWGTSRLTVQLFLVVSGAGLLAGRGGLRALERWVRGRGRNTRNVLVVGQNGLSRRYLETLEANPFWGVRPLGCLTAGDGGGTAGNGRTFARGRVSEASNDGELPVLGTLADMRSVLLARPVDEVAFALPAGARSDLIPAVQTCVEKGVTARIVLDVPEIGRGNVQFESLDGLPVMSVETTPPPSFRVLFKRLFDIAGALVGLVACGVVYLLYGLRIRRQSPGPLFFRQTRIGQNGRPFVLYKFRTMVDGAEHHKAELAAANEMEGPVFKIRDDPRITPVGRRMRQRHLDELPQFWNVLSGEMSLVGTRPPTPDEVARYDLRHHSRLAWKPGITGMWQVKEDVRDFDDIVRLDRQYIDSWSLGLDLKILAQTVRKVVRAQGA